MVPVAAAEHRSPSGGFQASPCLSRAALWAADELASARSGEERRESSRAPGGVVLVTFAETKVTQGAGRSNPQLAFEIARKAREPFKTWIPASAGMTTIMKKPPEGRLLVK